VALPFEERLVRFGGAAEDGDDPTGLEPGHRHLPDADLEADVIERAPVVVVLEGQADESGLVVDGHRACAVSPLVSMTPRSGRPGFLMWPSSFEPKTEPKQ